MFLSFATLAFADATLTGDYVKIHYNNNGIWNNSSGQGYQVQNGDGAWQEVTYPGSPWMQMTVEYQIDSSSYDYRGNWSGGSFGWTTTTSDLSAGSTNHISHVMTMGTLRITKDEIWEDGSKIVTLAFVVENTGGSTISNFRLIHGYDPDTDYNRYSTFNTYNDRSSDNLFVQAVAPYSSLTVAYGVCDSAKQDVGITGWDADADATLRDDGGSSGDNTIHWRHRETTINPYETIDFAGLAVFGVSAADARSQYDDNRDTLCDTVVCDLDEDGYERIECGGSDCDDEDPWVNPAAVEVPYDGIDNDCDGGDLADVDGDGFDWDGIEGGLDCDDADPAVHPSATERPYDGIDNDCDGGDLTDMDGDGYDWEGVGGDDCADGDASIHPGVDTETPDGTDEDCDGEVDEGTDIYDDDGDGYTETGGDCDDDDDEAHPGASETLDGVDEDCDGVVDDGTAGHDDDGDGLTELEGDCNDADPGVHPDAEEIWGDGIDNDCDGTVDSGATDVDGDGYSASAGDCDDEDVDTHPGAEEVADLIDNDCDGIVDEGTEYYDDDGDGLTEVEGDCNDDDYGVHPDAPEILDGIDNDCDGIVDEGTTGTDDDGDGFSEEAGDCDDEDEGVHPGAEEDPDNGIDDDCDDTIDEVAGDIDGDGVTIDDGDCDDEDGWVSPGVTEMCDGIDNNCNGEIDEGCDDMTLDGDGTTPGAKGGCSAVGGRGAGWLWWVGLLGLFKRRGDPKPCQEGKNIAASH